MAVAAQHLLYTVLGVMVSSNICVVDVKIWLFDLIKSNM